MRKNYQLLVIRSQLFRRFSYHHKVRKKISAPLRLKSFSQSDFKAENIIISRYVAQGALFVLRDE